MAASMERPAHPSPRGDDPVFSALWSAHRRRMLDLAFRMLLDLPDAEDIVQEAFTRLARVDLAEIADPEGWLVVVTSRLCLDKLRARHRHPNRPLHVEDDPIDRRLLDPSDQVTLVDDVTLAMHALLERLSPAERTSFVLHDVFQYPFEEVAVVVGRSPTSCRQLASRARRALGAEPGRFAVDAAQHRQLSERFIDACAGGDLDALMALLDPGVEGVGDLVAGAVVGADEVARGTLRFLGPPASPTMLYLPVGDRAGIVALRDHRVVALIVLEIDNGLVVHINALGGEGPRAAVSTMLGLR